MSKRTFILHLGEQDKNLVDDTDIISIITIRVIEIYLEINKQAEVPVEFLTIIKTFIEKNPFGPFSDSDLSFLLKLNVKVLGFQSLVIHSLLLELH